MTRLRASRVSFILRQLRWQDKNKRITYVQPYLSHDECLRILAQLDPEPYLVACLLFGGCLRLPEALRLRIKDLDSWDTLTSAPPNATSKPKHLPISACAVHYRPRTDATFGWKGISTLLFACRRAYVETLQY